MVSVGSQDGWGVSRSSDGSHHGLTSQDCLSLDATGRYAGARVRCAICSANTRPHPPRPPTPLVFASEAKPMATPRYDLRPSVVLRVLWM